MADVRELLELFDVTPTDPDRYIAQTGLTAGDAREVVEGAQIVGQAIVAASQRFSGKVVRSAHAVFARAVMVGDPVELLLDVVQEGRTTASVVVTAQQNGRKCVAITVLADTPSEDVISHQSQCPQVSDPRDAHPCPMPMNGREVRIVDVADAFSPDEVGPPELFAWVRYSTVPGRDDLTKALLTHFTGYLGIPTSMRAHPGIGTSQAHTTVSTAPFTLTIAFHEPVRWDGWLLYSHESTHAGSGMSYVRGTVHSEKGGLLASFVQESLIRPLRIRDASIEGKVRF